MQKIHQTQLNADEETSVLPFTEFTLFSRRQRMKTNEMNVDIEYMHIPSVCRTVEAAQLDP